MCVLAAERTRGVENTELQQLACVVPLVDGVADVEAFIALETNQVGVECGSGGGGQRRLADAGLALQEERSSQPEGQKQRDGQALIRHIALVCQPLPQVRE
jgi:hypothetical protein